MLNTSFPNVWTTFRPKKDGDLPLLNAQILTVAGWERRRYLPADGDSISGFLFAFFPLSQFSHFLNILIGFRCVAIRSSSS